MQTKGNEMRKTIGKEAVQKRIKKFVAVKKELRKDIENLHVKVQKGNIKTGANCWTVSLLPVIDCKNCDKCKWDCYDLKNDLIYPVVINDRCRNSVIHQEDIKRFWKEIDEQIKANFITELRLNVGGDLGYEDFYFVKELGEKNPRTMIMFFTKNYEEINFFLNENKFPENVKVIMSAWCGMEMDNPHNIPVAHVLYEDGKTTAPEFGAYYCGGNCSECAFNGEGCWNLKLGEHVIFRVH